MHNDLIQKITIRQAVKKQMARTFINLPFEVPQEIDEMRLCFIWDRSLNNGIDFALNDPLGYRGWSGGTVTKVVLTEDYATGGYLKGRLRAGKWELILGIASVVCECEARAEIELIKHAPAWIPGDFHLHTLNSDGVYSVDEVLDLCLKEGLSFAAISDHNVFTQNTDYKDRNDIIKIPAAELTTYFGHANFYGVDRPFSHFLGDQPELIQAYFNEGRQKGAFISLNHPFFKGKWQWGFDRFEFNIIEIINSRWSEGNKAAIAYWQSELEKGRRLTPIGGSDMHRNNGERWIGEPTTWVYTTARNVRGILSAVDHGRTCVSLSLQAPMAFLSYKQWFAGDRIQLKRNEPEIDCHIKNAVQSKIVLYTAWGRITSALLPDGDSIYSFSVPSDCRFVRCELWHTDEHTPQCFTAPLYMV